MSLKEKDGLIAIIWVLIILSIYIIVTYKTYNVVIENSTNIKLISEQLNRCY
jgi:hypothetical protein